jgi:peptide deformylase
MSKILNVNNSIELVTLKKRSSPVELPIDHSTVDIIKKMLYCISIQGKAAGLAAPQIGINKRIMICNIDHKTQNLESMINPVYYVNENSLEEAWEGCFSVPYTFIKVARWKTIDIEYYNIQGVLIKKNLTGFYARIYQHEYDHLDGVLITDRGIEKKSFATKESYDTFLQATKNLSNQLL